MRNQDRGLNFVSATTARMIWNRGRSIKFRATARPREKGMRESSTNRGEHYLYPAEYFVLVKLPVAISRKLESPPNREKQPVRGIIVRA